MNNHLVWTDVESSNIHSIAYDDKTETLCVRFLNGGLYSYPDVSNDLYVSLVHAESVGKYFARYVKVLPYIKWDNEAELISDLQLTR